MNKKIIFGMFVFLFVIVISSQLISAYPVEKGNKCYCASCYECMHALNYKDCHTIILERDIDISSGTGAYAKFNNGNCINNPKGFSGKTLDCQGYKIIGEKKKGFGIYLEDKNGNTIKNCQIINFNTGILLSSSNNSHILSNNISRNSHGAWLGYSCEDNFSNNNIFENTLGIQLISSNNSHISGNDIYDNKECGVWLVDSSGNNVSGNEIYDNKGCCGVWLNSSSGNNVSGNEISNNADGVWLVDSSGNTVSGNKIYNNKECGVWLAYSSGNNVSGNEISGNGLEGVGLYFSTNNLIYNNYFSDNHPNVKVKEPSGNMWNVTKKRLEKGTNIIGGEYLGGNYWSDYTGKDTDGDGLGDTLYYIISNEDKDYLPLVKSGESGNGGSGGNDNCVSEGGSCSLDSECCSGNCDSSHCCPSDRPVWDGSGCVECLSDDDCDSGYTCDVSSHTCVASGSGNSGGSGGGDKCGNGKLDGNEVCDGTDLNGKTCKDFKDKNGNAFTGGELSCKKDCSGFDTGKCYVKKPQYVYNTSKYSNSIIYKTSCSQISKGHSRFSTSGTCEKYNKCTKDNSAVLDFICYNTTKISQGVYKGNHCTSYAVENTVNSSLIDVSSIFGSADTGKVRVLNCSGSWGKGHCEVTDGVAHCCMEADQKCDDAHPCCSGACVNGKCEEGPVLKALTIDGSFEKCGQENNVEKIYFGKKDKQIIVKGNFSMAKLSFLYLCCKKDPTLSCSAKDKLNFNPSEKDNNLYSFSKTCTFDDFSTYYFIFCWSSDDENLHCEPVSYISTSFVEGVNVSSKPCKNEYGVSFADGNSPCYGEGIPFTVFMPKTHPALNVSLVGIEDKGTLPSSYEICNEDNTACDKIYSIAESYIQVPVKLNLILKDKNTPKLDLKLVLKDSNSKELAELPFTVGSACKAPTCSKGEDKQKVGKNCSELTLSDVCCDYYVNTSSHTCYYNPSLSQVSQDNCSCVFESKTFDPAFEKCTPKGVVHLHELICSDGLDDDDDGLTDCLDPDCYTKPSTFNWITYAKEHVHSTQDCVPSIQDAYPGCGVAQCGQYAGDERCNCWINQPKLDGGFARKSCELTDDKYSPDYFIEHRAGYLGLDLTEGEKKCIEAGGFCIDRKYLDNGKITIKINGKSVTKDIQGVCSATPGLVNIFDKSGKPMFCGSCNVMCCKVNVPDTQHNCGSSGEPCCLSGCEEGLSCCYSKDYPLGVCEESCQTDQAAINLFTQAWGKTSNHWIYGSTLDGSCFHLKVDSEGKVVKSVVCNLQKGFTASNCDDRIDPHTCKVTYYNRYNQDTFASSDLGSQVSNIINQYISFLQQSSDQTLAGDLLKNPGFEQGSKFWTLSGNAKIDSIGGVGASRSLELSSGSAHQLLLTDFSVGDTFVLSAQRAVSDNHCKITFKVGMFDPNDKGFVKGEFSSDTYSSKTSGGFSDVRYTIKKDDISKGYVLAVGVSTSGCTAWVDNLILKKLRGSSKHVVGYMSLCGPANELNVCNKSLGLVCKPYTGTYRCLCPDGSDLKNGKCVAKPKPAKDYNLLKNGNFSQLDDKGYAKFWQPDFKPNGNSVILSNNQHISQEIHLDAGTYFFESECKPVGKAEQPARPHIELRLTPVDPHKKVDEYFDAVYDMMAFEYGGQCDNFVYVAKPGDYYFSIFGNNPDWSKLFQTPDMQISNLKLYSVPQDLITSHNLVKNPSFEQGLTGWDNHGLKTSVECARVGSEGLSLAPSGDKVGYVSQKFDFSSDDHQVYYLIFDCNGAMSVSMMGIDNNGNPREESIKIGDKTYKVGSSLFQISRGNNAGMGVCAVRFEVDKDTNRCSDPRHQDYSNRKPQEYKPSHFVDDLKKQSASGIIQWINSYPDYPGLFLLKIMGGGTKTTGCADNIIIEPQSDFVKDINEYYKELEEGAKHDQQGGEDQQENKNNEQGKNDNNQQGNNNQQGEGETGKGDKDEETNPESLSVDVCHYETCSENGKNKYFVVSDGKLYSCSKLNSQSVPENDFSDCSLVSNACPDSYNVVKALYYNDYGYALCRGSTLSSHLVCKFNIGDNQNKPSCILLGDSSVDLGSSDFSIANNKLFFTYYNSKSDTSGVAYFNNLENFPNIKVQYLSDLESSEDLFTHVFCTNSALYFSQKQESDDSTYLIKLYSGGKISHLKTVNKIVTCIKKVDGVVKYFTASSSKPVFDSESKSVAGGGLNVVK